MSASPSISSWPERLCGRPEFESRLRDETAFVVNGLLSAVTKPLEAVFIAGSVAAGEAVMARADEGAPAGAEPGESAPARADEGAVCLSDLDLGLVLRSAEERAPVREAVASWLSSGSARRSRSFFSKLDVGIYAPADLPAQPLKPGTFEMAAKAFVVHGNRGALSALPRFDAASMPPIEARRLVANRAAELMAVVSPGPAAREREGVRPLDAAYAAGKLVLDAGTALLVPAGAFRAGLDARLEALEHSGPMREAFAADADRYLEAARFWTAVRRGRIEWAEVSRRYPAVEGDHVAAPLWNEARRAVEAVWAWLDRKDEAPWQRTAPLRERARRWRDWSRGRSPRAKLEALSRIGRAGPRECADDAAVKLFMDWPSGEGSAPVSAPVQAALRRLLPSGARASERAPRETWARILLAARGAFVRAGDE